MQSMCLGSGLQFHPQEPPIDLMLLLLALLERRQTGLQYSARAFPQLERPQMQ